MSDQTPRPDSDRPGPGPDGGQPDASGQTQYDPQQYGQPQYDAQQYGHPQYDAQQYGQPQYDAQQYGQPQYDAQQYGQPQSGQYEQQAYGQQPHDPYGQQQYPGQPYGQQYPGQQYPQPHGQYPPQYGQQYPQQYGQQYPPQYPQQYGQYPVAPYGQQDADRPENTRPGLIGLVIVAVCTLAVMATGYVAGQAAGTLVMEYGLEATQNIDPNDPAVIAMGERIAGWSYLGMGASVAGIIGWVMSIVAVNRRTGRTFGIIGIILGLAAPVLALIAMMVGMWPAIEALS